MARRKIGLEDFLQMEIDPDTGELFWNGAQVVTQSILSLPTWLNILAGAAAAVAILKFGLEIAERRGWIRPAPSKPINVTVHLGSESRAARRRSARN